MANKIALWAWHLVAAHIFARYSQHLLVNVLPEKLILALFQTA